MVIVMEMGSGKLIAEESFCAYDQEVLNAGWTEVPPIGARIEPRLQEVAAAREEPAAREVEGFTPRRSRPQLRRVLPVAAARRGEA